jgi:hypothetical protein
MAGQARTGSLWTLQAEASQPRLRWGYGFLSGPSRRTAGRQEGPGSLKRNDLLRTTPLATHETSLLSDMLTT